MADLRLSGTFDLRVLNGDLQLCESLADSLIQGGRVAIKLKRGDNIFHEEYGNDLYNDRVKITNEPLTKQYCTKAILSSSDMISSVNQVVVNNVGEPNDLDVSFAIKMATIIEEPIEEDEEEQEFEYV